MSTKKDQIKAEQRAKAARKKSQQHAIDLYAALVREVRQRIETINFVMGTQLPDAMKRETCFLQLRMLCETIAIGCLVANGDIAEPKIKDFEKEWAATKILKRLEEINPHYFPQQVTLQPGRIDANTNPNALTKAELFDLYGKSGDVLHLGSVKKILAIDPLKQKTVDLSDIIPWTQKIADLMSAHMIVIGAEDDTMAIMMLGVLYDQAQNMQSSVKRIEYAKVVNNRLPRPSL